MKRLLLIMAGSVLLVSVFFGIDMDSNGSELQLTRIEKASI